MATALVTGATGLVGSHLVERLLEHGDRVRALVRSTSRTDLLEEWGVRLVYGELVDRATLRDAVEGSEVVYHCAARPPLGGTAQEFYRDNVEGTGNLLDAAWEAGVERFVHVSTVDVYGYTHHDGADERTPFRPDGLYSWSKIEAERVAMSYYEKHGFPVSIVRPCLIYGPRDRHLLPSVLRLVGRKLAPVVAGGRALLDVVYVKDVADALVLAATQRVAIGQAYNITDGARRTLRAVLEAFAQAIGQMPRFVHFPYAAAYGAALLASGLSYPLRLSILPVLRWEVIKAMGHHRHFSIAKAEQELGFRPRTPLEQGLQQTLAWHQAEGLQAVPSEPMR